MELDTYRLNSKEEPTDEQLYKLMEQVGKMARESSHNAQKELKRRLQEVAKKIAQNSQSSSWWDYRMDNSNIGNVIP